MNTKAFPYMDNNQQTMRLPRSLSALETWGFGLSGLLLWLGTAPSMHAALGLNAIFVWLPSAFAGILLNLQVQRLGRYLPDMSGGTPNYAAYLLKHYRGLGRYGAIGYWLGWVSVPAINAIILTDLIKANFEPLGISCPEMLLKVGFTSLPFVIALSGTRTLGIVHSFFVIPTIGFLLAFCIQGISWLGLSPNSPGLFPSNWLGGISESPLNFVEWAKWFFIAVYAVYGCETASSFAADSRRPKLTLRCLPFAASLIPFVYLGGSWVLTRLATQPQLSDNAFLNLVAAASPFWGKTASFLVTFLIASGCLLSSATAVSNSPRVLYQLALDKHLSPVFAVVSRRGILEPGLLFTLLASLLCLLWGDVTRVVMVTGTGYLTSMMIVHLGLWLRRGRPEVLYPWLAGGFFLIEAVVLVVGGFGWSWQDLLIGLLLPIGTLSADVVTRHIGFPPFHPTWWIKRYRSRSYRQIKDFVLLQVGILLLLVCGAATVGWAVRDWLDKGLRTNTFNSNLFVLLLLLVAFVGVAIACWTSLPQVASIVEAREDAEHLFMIAQDGILVLDYTGVIRQANPAAESLLNTRTQGLLGRHLNNFLEELAEEPSAWQSRSEQTLNQDGHTPQIIEVAVSDRSLRDLQEYVVIMRDVTERKQAAKEAAQRTAELQQALQLKNELAATATAQANQLEQALQDLQITQDQLIQSLESDRVLKEVTDQMRKTLDSKTILQTIVREVRSLLHTDRVVIYQFDPNWQGQVVVEAVTGDWQSLLNRKFEDECFCEEYSRRYKSGRVRVVNNVAQSDLQSCHQEFLQNIEVQANLVVPIRIEAHLWGLLIAHECTSPRAWQTAEIELLQQLANQAAIAIQQAELYEQSCRAATVAMTQAEKLETALQELQHTQAQLIQTEKMSSLGQLVAGVAHEINNPVNFIYGNLTHVGDYTQDLLSLIDLYQDCYPTRHPQIQQRIKEIDIDFLVQDLPKTLSSMKLGADRIRQIVLTLRNFSRLDEAEMKPVNIHDGIDSTLLILQNRFKAKPEHSGIQIIKEYSDLPEVECYAGQLNQVFMNILTNAIDALHQHDKKRSLEEIKKSPSTITIHTQVLAGNSVGISIKDNGMGMSPSVRARLFDPFFTTKKVGEGTGLGLSISYQIVVDKHGGKLKCLSAPGKGAEFQIEIPIQQSSQSQLRVS